MAQFGRSQREKAVTELKATAEDMLGKLEGVVGDDAIGDIVDRILRAGRKLREASETGELQDRAQALLEQGEDKLADVFNIAPDEASRDDFRTKARTGAGIGGLALLLSGRAGRNTAGIAGLAALGGLAYAAYKANGDKLPTSADEVVGLITGAKAERRSQALLTAMVAAAQHGGEVTEQEREIILQHGSADAVDAVMQARPGVGTVSALADSEQAAREIYAASARIADGVSEQGRDYLDRLAMAMGLDPETAARIETDVRV